MPAAVIPSSHGRRVGGRRGSVRPPAASPTTRPATCASRTAARCAGESTSRDGRTVWPWTGRAIAGVEYVCRKAGQTALSAIYVED